MQNVCAFLQFALQEELQGISSGSQRSYRLIRSCRLIERQATPKKSHLEFAEIDVLWEVGFLGCKQPRTAALRAVYPARRVLATASHEPVSGCSLLATLICQVSHSLCFPQVTSTARTSLFALPASLIIKVLFDLTTLREVEQ